MSGRYLLSARGLTFGYRHGELILQDWTASFSSGSITALTGRSGSGKSTLLYILGLMVGPSSGEVLIDGARVDHLKDSVRASLRARLFGFVFQDAALDPTRTVLDNVIETAFYRDQSRTDAMSAAHRLLQRFGVEPRATHKPGEISGGQAQRIALCRALLGNPRIVLADEPTGNLDLESRAVVLDALRAQADGGSVVIIATHDPGVTAKCDDHISLRGLS